MRVFQWLFAGLGLLIIAACLVFGWAPDKGDVWLVCSGDSLTKCDGVVEGTAFGFNTVLGAILGLAFVLIAVLIGVNTPRPVRSPRQQSTAPGQYPPYGS